MCRAFVVLLIGLLLVPDLAAQSKGDWKNVEKLKPGTLVQVVLEDGRAPQGRVGSVSDSELKIFAVDSGGSAGRWTRDFSRADIQRIVRFHKLFVPTNAKKVLAISVAAAGAAGVTVGAISDSRHRTNGRWVIDGVAGAGLGLLAWDAFCAAVVVYDLALLPFRRKVVYENVTVHTPPRS